MIHIMTPIQSLDSIPTGLRLFGALALAMTLFACDDEPEVIRRNVIIEQQPASTTASQGTMPEGEEYESLYEEALDDSVEDIEKIDRVIAGSYEESEPEGVTPNMQAQEISDAQIDGLVSDALATREGRQMLAPLFGSEMLAQEAARQPASSNRPARVVIEVKGQPSAQQSAQNTQQAAQPGYYVGAGYVGAAGQPLFVDPSGQIVDADGLATNPINSPTNAYELSPTGFQAPINNPARTRTSPSGSPLISQVPPRSSLPSQIPAGAGNVGRAPAVGPAVSGPGVAGF